MKAIYSITLCTALLLGAAMPLQAATEIKPGQTWNATSGSAINAHGGCVQYSDGYYYWFGESRNKGTWTGVGCYRSEDLVNWTYVGLALKPTGTQTDACEDIASGRLLERPKVIYNQATGKWVMWAHWENGDDYTEAKVCVAQSDTVVGPYELVGVFRPNGNDSRDQTLFLDDDGTAYHIYSTATNTNTNISPLSADYLSPLAEVNTQMRGKKYEAAAVWRTGDIYFGIFSGCTGWTPNKGRYAYATDMMGNWVTGNEFKDSDGSTGVNFCTDSGKDYSYTSQSAYVFPVQDKPLCYVYMGDRWNSSNVGSSTYVWLPLSMRSGYPRVRWYDSWDMSVFDDMQRYKRVDELEDGMELLLLEKFSDRIVSKVSASLSLQDDDSTNVTFVFHAVEDMPYTYRIENKQTEKYLQSLYGSIRYMSEQDDDAQLWTLTLEEDGYYKIQNRGDGLCLSVSGNETMAGTTLYLADESSKVHQSFALYFDSQTHSEYAEADIFSLEYRQRIAQKIADQELYTAVNDVKVSNNRATEYYNITGQRIQGMSRGINLVRMADGTVRKVIQK